MSPKTVLRQLIPARSYEQLDNDDILMGMEHGGGLVPPIQRTKSDQTSVRAPWLELHLQQQTQIMQEILKERGALREENALLRKMLRDAESTIQQMRGRQEPARRRQRAVSASSAGRMPGLATSPSLDDQSLSSSSFNSTPVRPSQDPNPLRLQAGSSSYLLTEKSWVHPHSSFPPIRGIDAHGPFHDQLALSPAKNKGDEGPSHPAQEAPDPPVWVQPSPSFNSQESAKMSPISWGAGKSMAGRSMADNSAATPRVSNTSNPLAALQSKKKGRRSKQRSFLRRGKGGKNKSNLKPVDEPSNPEPVDADLFAPDTDDDSKASF